MRIVSLVENTTETKMRVKHGLSLYIETKSHRLLFDLGPDKTLFENAKRKNIDLSEVDIVIISHGHMDHGGALGKFLEVNHTAKVYIQRSAFEPHYSKTAFIKIPVGLDKSLMNNAQMVLLDGDCIIDDELSLFTVSDSSRCHSPMNDVLLDKKGRDRFEHEQNLIIKQNKTALIMGCGHTGVVNAMKTAEQYHPDICVGGFHLCNPVTGKTVSRELLDSIAQELGEYKDTEFYTCHCTGMKAFKRLSSKLGSLKYLHCGDEIEI